MKKNEMPLEDSKQAELENFIKETHDKEYSVSYLIAVLHKAQKLYGHLGRETMDFISESMNIPTAHIWGVATFYHYFNLKPRGKYVISVCLGTACYVKGAGEIADRVKSELKVDFGETTEDRLFTLQEARCLGSCGLAPVVMIGDKIYGGLTPKKTTELIQDIRKREKTEN